MSNAKRNKDDKAGEGKVKFQGFLSLNLSPQEKAHIVENATGVETHSQLLADACMLGYKMSLSFSPRQDSYILTAYGNRIGNVDAGWALSIWHKDFTRCFDVLAFCLDEMGKAGSLTEWLGEADDYDW